MFDLISKLFRVIILCGVAIMFVQETYLVSQGLGEPGLLVAAMIFLTVVGYIEGYYSGEQAAEKRSVFKAEAEAISGAPAGIDRRKS